MNKISDLFDIKYPLIQGGMIWVSGWKLAAAVSNSGALGLIGAGSMHPPLFREHIKKCQTATKKPFGVNIPLLYPQTEELINIVLEEKVKIVFTSAGNPQTWTGYLKENGVTVVHVVSNTRFALKAQQAGVDAVVAEGFEAGGHNGLEETATMVLIPLVCDAVTIPVIAAGGIGSGRAMAASMVLGAEGVQVGSRFVATQESSAHPGFKEYVVRASEGDTALTLKKLIPVRLLKNKFFNRVEELQDSGGSPEQLQELLGEGRAKQGMFIGDLEEGELEIGQVSAIVKNIEPAATVIAEIIAEFNSVCQSMNEMKF